MAIFSCAIGEERQLSQLVRDGPQSIKHLSDYIRHVKSTRWGIYFGFITGMGMLVKNGR
jgi:hypothetical protein